MKMAAAPEAATRATCQSSPCGSANAGIRARGGDLLEVAPGAVGMVPPGQLAVGGLQLVGARGRGDTEDRVEIGGLPHVPFCRGPAPRPVSGRGR
jgi:hypothetical protein